METVEFEDVERALGRYRPAGPTPEAAGRIAGALACHRNRPRWWAQAAAAFVLLAVPLGVWMWMSRSSPQSERAEASVPAGFAAEWSQQPRIELPWVTAEAPVVVVGFNDWLCSGCLEVYVDLEPVLREIEQRHPGAVSLTLEDWPWDLECNPYRSSPDPAQKSMHPGACDVAIAVRLAKARGEDSDLISWIRAHLEEWRTSELPEVLRPAQDAPGRDAAVAAMREGILKGQRVGINTTPTYFVNGVKLSGLKSREIEWAIRLELERRK